nr:unnamed protein product [Spirometra erinaceieuropaei]
MCDLVKTRPLEQSTSSCGGIRVCGELHAASVATSNLIARWSANRIGGRNANIPEAITRPNSVFINTTAPITSAVVWQNITYSGRTSPRFGRTNSKEQYGLLYNPNKVKLENESEIAVHKRDFERPPYCYSFKTVEKKPLTFAALVTHIDPDAVSTEMDNLYETVKQCTHASRTENIIVLGDMNAGCRYLSKKKKRELKFVKDSSFKWLISDDMDTTVASQDCALDRPTQVKLENESEIAVHKRDFERPPYCYSFKTVEKKPLTFAALVTHIDPDAVSTEMDNLYETVKQYESSQ